MIFTSHRSPLSERLEQAKIEDITWPSWRYEITLLVLKKYFIKIKYFFNARREISYLQRGHIISSMYSQVK